MIRRQNLDRGGLLPSLVKHGGKVHQQNNGNAGHRAEIVNYAVGAPINGLHRNAEQNKAG